ncbi:MAG: DEAD/DEAH box helicase, partial [Bradymonadaceae bacterium]
ESAGYAVENSDPDTDEGDVAHLRPWQVPVLTLPGEAAVEWLREEWPEMRGIAFGHEWPVWRRCARLAVDLVDAGHLVPTLERGAGDEGPPQARWRPVPARGAVLAELHQLESALPPSVRADATFEEVEEPTPATFCPPSTREILARGLASLVDGLARVRLRSHDGITAFDDPTPQESWLSALADEDPTVRADDEQLARLHRQLEDWTRDLRHTQQRRVRLHFRLHPPTMPENSGEMVPVDTPWRLEFLLQSIQEPSLVVEAETVWEAADRARELLDTRLDRPRERLLEELGRARKIFPPLERALEARQPTALELQTDEAFQFLEDHADLLDQAGFSIQIPDWWDQPGHRLSARLRGSDSGSGDLGLETVCRFDWEVVLGDETLDREQLEQLAKLKQPLVRHRGEWVALDPDDIDAALELLENTSGEMEAGEALRTRLGLEETNLPVTDADFDGWLGELFETASDERVEPRPTPENFEGELRPYQSRGLGWIRYLEQLGLGGCLADDMGLGKTIQVLARLAEERLEADDSPGPTLAVVPLSVVGNWRHEAERFVPELEVRIYHGPDRVSGSEAAETLPDADLVITTYGVVRSDVETLVTIRWHRVVLDEAQKVKNSAAGRTRAVRRLRADRRLALTGTPVENRLTELWSIMEFLNPGMLGPEKRFRKEIAEPVEAGDARKTEVLRRLTDPFILRRLKTDEQIIDDLPEKTEIKEYCHLTEEQV